MLCPADSGGLLPRHIEIFSRNPFFRGMSIPEPELVVSVLFNLILFAFLMHLMSCSRSSISEAASLFSVFSGKHNKKLIIKMICTLCYLSVTVSCHLS